MKIVFANLPVFRTAVTDEARGFKLPLWVKLGNQLPRRIRDKYFGLVATALPGLGARFGVRAGSRWPWTMPIPHGNPHFPFFMAYAAAMVRSQGHEVDIYDGVAAKEYDYERYVVSLAKRKADIVVIETSTPTWDIDAYFARKIAAFTEVALAGPHINHETLPEIQKQLPEVSYFLVGEYINSALEMTQTRRKGVYAENILMEIDAAPFPYRDYEFGWTYFDPTMPTPKPQLQVYGSKGCPFKCTFCMWPQVMYKKKVALRSPESIAQEIREAVALHGYKSVFFDDDTFNMGTDRISRLCDELKVIGLPWTMMGRLDCSPDWLYDKMIDSGCVGMRFGVETFDLQVLANVKKGIERKDFRGALERLCSKYPHLMIHITMMKDMPGQTEEAHELDMQIIRDMGFTTHDMRRSYQLSHCAPFPGTELYEQLKGSTDTIILQDFRKYDGGQDTVMKEIGG